jgi:hypothetical protein
MGITKREGGERRYLGLCMAGLVVANDDDTLHSGGVLGTD